MSPCNALSPTGEQPIKNWAEIVHTEFNLEHHAERGSNSLASKCSHEDSRLACTECNAPLCSKCLVQCPVGFRCKACVGPASSPLKSGSSMLVARVLALSGVIGSGGGWLMPMINVPYIACIICYFLGFFCGRFLAKFIDYRIENNATKIIVFGLLIGLSLSPFSSFPFMLLEVLKTSLMGAVPIFTSLNFIVGSLFSPVLFVVGVLKSTVWRQRW